MTGKRQKKKREKKLRERRARAGDWKKVSPSDRRDGRRQIVLVLTVAAVGAGIALYGYSR